MAYTQSVLQTELSKQREAVAGWPWRLMTLSFIIFLAVVAVYVGMRFGFEEVYLKRALSQEDAEFSATFKSVSPEEQRAVFNLYSQLSNIDTLLKKQGKASPYFSLIEQYTLKTIVYSAMDLRFSDRSAILVLNGKTSAYASVVQQLELYKKISNVTDVKLLGARFISPAEGVDFSIQLTIAR